MLSMMDLIIALKRIPLFSSVHGEGLKRVAETIREMKLPAGELVFAEHDLGDEMYIVHSGRVLIFNETGSGENVLNSVRSGGYFGEMAIIDEQPRSASARSTEDSVLLVLHKNDFNIAVHDYPEIAFEVMKEFIRRLREADQRIRTLAGELQRGQVETE
jgi:CRP-like cAMP-binding protein